MNNPFACADFTFPLLSHEKALDVIALLGFDGADIGLFESRSHLWPSREFKNVAKAARTLRGKLEDRGLATADIFLQTAADFTSLAPNHPNAAKRRKAREIFQRTLEYAKEANSAHVSVLPGVYFRDEESKAVSWARCCEELAWRVEQAKTAEVIFGVEAHLGSIAPKPKDAARLVRDVPGLTLTLDYTHFAYQGIPDLEVEPLLAYASHFHARCATKKKLQSLFRENTIDYQRILSEMQRVNYTGYIGVEYVWIDWEGCNRVDNISETIQLRDFLKSNRPKAVRQT